MGCVSRLSLQLNRALTRCISTVEDQQRINTFSKLNTRLSGIKETIEALKVRTRVPHCVERIAERRIGREGGP